MNESISFTDACRHDRLRERGDDIIHELRAKKRRESGSKTHSQETTERSRYAKLNPNTIPMARVRMKDRENR